MKKFRSSLLVTLIVCFLLSISTVDAFAGGYSSKSGSSSTKSSTTTKSSPSPYSSKTPTKSAPAPTKPTAPAPTPTKPTTDSTKSATSSKSAEGFKSGSFSSKSAPTKDAVTSGTVNKSVDTSSPALKSIPSDYSSRSVNNHYYYNDYGNSGFDSFMSHYWFYRAMEPSHRVYYVNDTPQYAPAYTGGFSVIWDVLTFLFIIGLVSWAVYYFWWRRRR